MKTMQDLRDDARRRVGRIDRLAMDVADENGAIYRNVQGMKWFEEAVMERLANDQEQYAHLRAELAA